MEDAEDFETILAAHDFRADLNNNGRFDPEPFNPDPNQPQVATWPGSDTQIFATEYITTYLAHAGVHEKQVRALGVLSQPEKADGFYPTVGVNNRLGYRGYWYEPEIGKYLCRNRVYDPRFGRWLTRDPIGVAGGWNLYRYCEGRPSGRYDPMGLYLWGLGEILADAWDGAETILDWSSGRAGQEEIRFHNAIQNASANQMSQLRQLASESANARSLLVEIASDSNIALANQHAAITLVGNKIAKVNAGIIGSGVAFATAGMGGYIYNLVVGTAVTTPLAPTVLIAAGSGAVGDAATQSAEMLFGIRQAYDMQQTILVGASSALAGGVMQKAAMLARGLWARAGAEAVNPVRGLPRIGSATKGDAYHAFNDLVDNYAHLARRFEINDGGLLFQLEGAVGSKAGVFEWIVRGGKVVHRRFIREGGIAGCPNQTP